MTTIAINNQPDIYERYLAIIKSYLKQDNSDSAILINGEWGSGKTFFVNGVLREGLIKEGYKIVYVSLFGISSIEGLKDTIFTSAMKEKLGSENSTTKPKNTNILLDLGRKFIDQITNKYTGEKLSSIAQELVLDSFFNDNKILVIFDDLERCETKLNEILGFINSFVEHKKIKSILIADETKIKKEFREEYERRKEKLISRTIKFETDLSLLYDKIIETNKESEHYFAFLQKQKETLVFMCKKFDLHNLRTFSFALGILKEVYEATNRDIDWYPQESVETIILFVLSMSIEFKNGNISENDKKYFHNEVIIHPLDGYAKYLREKVSKNTEKNQASIEEKSIKDKFKEKYINNTNYKYNYFDSIFNFIINGYFDREQYLTSELNSFLPMDKPEMYNVYDYFVNVRYIYEINDKYFNEKMELFLRYIEDGNYTYYEYYYILTLLIRFESLIIDREFYEKFKIGFNNSINKFLSYFNNNDLDRIEQSYYRAKSFENVSDIRLDNVYSKIKAQHFKALEKNNEELAINMLKLLKDTENPEAFSNYAIEYSVNYEVLYTINPDNVVSLLPDISNKMLSNFLFSLRDTQPDSGNKILYKYSYNLISLREKMSLYLQNIFTDMLIRKYIIEYFAIPILDSIINRKDAEIYLTLLAYFTQFTQTFNHSKDKKLHIQASYALDTAWFAMQFRFVEQPASGELEATKIDLEAVLTEENTTKEAFLQEIQHDKKIIFYDIETLYVFNSPTLERWTPEHAMQDARDVLGIMFNSLPNYPQAI